jgi:hypothetical protein
MRRGRPLVWIIVGSVVAAVAVVLALIHITSGTSPSAASSAVPPASAGASTQSSRSAPVVVPQATRTSSYLSGLKPSGPLAELVNPGPVKISGSIYPKSISFYCNVGDPTPFPAYMLKPNDRRFQATIGLAPLSPSQFRGIIFLVADGRKMQTFSVSVGKPRTVDVNLKGVNTFRLECFGSGNSYTGGEAVAVVWGNARFSGGR